jgi:hypothetical protein
VIKLIREIAEPSGTPATHRNAITSADSSTPTAANFAMNPNNARKARMWVTVSFTGGSSPTIDITPYFKPRGASTPIGEGEPVEYDGSDGLPAGTFVVDVDVFGSDLFAYIDNAGGSPSAFSVTVKVQWI